MSSLFSDKKRKRLAEFALQIEKGNFSYNLENANFKGEDQILYSALVKIRNSLVQSSFETQVISSQISSVSEQLMITMEDNMSFTGKLMKEAGEMITFNNNSSIEISNAVNETVKITKMMEEVVNTSSEMEVVSVKSREIIESSLKQILGIVTAVKEIEKSISTTLSYIEELNSISKEITNILSTVDQIANQTQLLSLNASIESARAGEYGKGFGVVADEIRKLSENSKDSVSKIGELVYSITDQISKVTDAVHSNETIIEKSVEDSKNIEEYLKKIGESYSNVHSMVRNIMDMSGKEYSMISNINSNILSVKSAFDEVSTSIDNVYDSIQVQNRNINDMENMNKSLSKASETLTAFKSKFDNEYTLKKAMEFSKLAENVIALIKNEVLPKGEFSQNNIQLHKELLDTYINNNSLIEAIWTNDKKGKFIYSNPPAGIVNAMVRPWFKESIANKEYISEIYISAITKSPCITISMPVKDKAGNITGVIGADLHIDAQ